MKIYSFFLVGLLTSCGCATQRPEDDPRVSAAHEKAADSEYQYSLCANKYGKAHANIKASPSELSDAADATCHSYLEDFISAKYIEFASVRSGEMYVQNPLGDAQSTGQSLFNFVRESVIKTVIEERSKNP